MTLQYVQTFAQSNLSEVPIYYWFLKSGAHQKEGSFKFNFLRCLLFVTAMNAMTHPLVFFGWMAMPSTYLTNILVAECFAVVVEAGLLIYFARVNFQRAFAASFLANLFSWQVGPILTYLFLKS